MKGWRIITIYTLFYDAIEEKSIVNKNEFVNTIHAFKLCSKDFVTVCFLIVTMITCTFVLMFSYIVCEFTK